MFPLLAQTVPELPHWQWWSNWGIAGVLVFVGVSVLLYGLREWWQVRRPYVIEKQKLDLEREQKQAALLDTLRECQTTDQEYKRRQVALTERLAAGQEGHARDCANTHRLVEALANKLGAE